MILILLTNVRIIDPSTFTYIDDAFDILKRVIALFILRKSSRKWNSLYSAQTQSVWKKSLIIGIYRIFNNHMDIRNSNQKVPINTDIMTKVCTLANNGCTMSRDVLRRY